MVCELQVTDRKEKTMKKIQKIILILTTAVFFIMGGSLTARAAVVPIPIANEEEKQITVNIGDTGTFQPNTTGMVDYTGQPVEVSSWSYSTYNSEVLAVDAAGNFQVLAAGEATVSITGTNQYGSEVFQATCELTAVVDMTNVTLEKDSLTGYICGYETFREEIKINSQTVLGSDNTTVTCLSSDMDMCVSCEVENNVLVVETSSEGNAVLTVTINGKPFTIQLKVNRISMSKTNQVAAKKKSFQLKVKGTRDVVKWTSSNPRVASVSASGKVMCKKTGNAVITASIGEKKTGCAVSVVSSGMLKVIKRAKFIGSHWKYSQPKRMSKGFYDCSSLVWKSYAKIGKTFGSRNYAPVAADLAKWCKQRGRVLTKSYTSRQIQKMKFNPGDLMFETGKKNGRYKGIYHVEMFVGYDLVYYDESGKPVLSEMWAARPTGYYGGGYLMERPFK